MGGDRHTEDKPQPGRRTPRHTQDRATCVCASEPGGPDGPIPATARWFCPHTCVHSAPILNDPQPDTALLCAPFHLLVSQGCEADGLSDPPRLQRRR